MTEVLKKTPFHERIAPLNQANAWERWAGYTTASLFYELEEEYFAIRTGASLYDVSPMIKYRVTGPDAAAVVDRLVTRNITKLKPGRVAYTPWCDGKGRVVEEGTVFRLGENEFRINCAEHQLAWLTDAAWGFDAAIEDVSEEIAGLALQGPQSRLVLEDIGLTQATALPFFGIVTETVDGLTVTVSRTGFTGDLGYELWVAPTDALALWDRLMEWQTLRYLRPIGARALDRARIEAGHILVNVEYVGARRAIRESQARTPEALGLGWTVDFSKPHFTGKRALLEERAAGGPKRSLVGLDIQGRKPAVGAYLYEGRREVGQITSATWSPVLKKNIALATVDAAFAKPGTRLNAEIYYLKEITQGRVDVTATVVATPFYAPAHRRK